MKSEILTAVAFDLIEKAATSLPSDVKIALREAFERETNLTGKTQLEAILSNIELAEKQKAPICQDTGTISFFVKAGSRVKNLEQIEPALKQAVEKATEQIPLRPNAVDPFTEKNTGNNLGRGIPSVYWEIVPGDGVEFTVMMKGGGSENVSVLRMLSPSQGVEGLKTFVVDAVVKAAGQPCPPTVLGVAVGGGADMAVALAKKALLRSLKEPNSDPKLADLEQELLKAANSTGIGPMGLGGDTTVLGVHVDYAFRHPASFPAAVVFSCWCDRRAKARIDAEGRVMYSTNGNNRGASHEHF